jgi:hypothetical protein
MVSDTIGMRSIPGRAWLELKEEIHGYDLQHHKRLLEEHLPNYEIPSFAPRTNRVIRNSNIPPPRKLVLCSGTLIVVPPNLLHQWQEEIRKHVRKGALKVLVMDSETKEKRKIKRLETDEDDMDLRSVLPSATELLTYDIIIFTRRRFEQEIRDGTDVNGRRLTHGAPLACNCSYIGSSRVRDCRCTNEKDIYSSSLMKLHWLRIIVDEGHTFSAGDTNAVLVTKQLQAERRWAVSGTPAKDLVGVEVVHTDPRSDRQLAVEARKEFDSNEDRQGAVKALGLLASHFLKVQPWYDGADWDDYIYRHEKRRYRTYSAFSASFRRTLEGLVVKTRPEDVERDIKLPLMKHKPVYLKPCWFDKMTANLFVQVLRANMITSERTGVDYLFQPKSIKERHALMQNLRQSNFTWTGFTPEHVTNTLEATRTYLEKEDKNCSPEDAALLLESSQIVEGLLDSPEWIALGKSHEVGIAVESWPQDSEETFALAYPNKPTMVGITPLIEAQAHVDCQLAFGNPTEGLQSVGVNAYERIYGAVDKNGAYHLVSAITGDASSASNGELAASHRISLNTPLKGNLQDALKLGESLRSDSPLLGTRILGTTSAKLTYLLEQVLEHQATCKIIVFYDNEHAGWYMAQGLEVIYVDYRIYGRALSSDQRSNHVALFAEDPSIRVLLIDVGTGALGLNLNAANRVYIINPINRPDIEAQAIKRGRFSLQYFIPIY